MTLLYIVIAQLKVQIPDYPSTVDPWFLRFVGGWGWERYRNLIKGLSRKAFSFYREANLFGFNFFITKKYLDVLMTRKQNYV